MSLTLNHTVYAIKCDIPTICIFWCFLSPITYRGLHTINKVYVKVIITSCNIINANITFIRKPNGNLTKKLMISLS